jgi:hypothetical protein
MQLLLVTSCSSIWKSLTLLLKKKTTCMHLLYGGFCVIPWHETSVDGLDCFVQSITLRITVNNVSFSLLILHCLCTLKKEKNTKHCARVVFGCHRCVKPDSMSPCNDPYTLRCISATKVKKWIVRTWVGTGWWIKGIWHQLALIQCLSSIYIEWQDLLRSDANTHGNMNTNTIWKHTRTDKTTLHTSTYRFWTV